jgi:hypothetical protein
MKNKEVAPAKVPPPFEAVDGSISSTSKVSCHCSSNISIRDHMETTSIHAGQRPVETIEAIPTVYAGVRFKSRLEARFAEWLTEEQEVEWEYEPEDFCSPLHNGYRPDFYIPCIETFVEIKPRAKMDELRMFYDHIYSSSRHWILVDKLDRDHWTIIRQNGACGVLHLSAGNYFTIRHRDGNIYTLRIHTGIVELCPSFPSRLIEAEVDEAIRKPPEDP